MPLPSAVGTRRRGTQTMTMMPSGASNSEIAGSHVVHAISCEYAHSAPRVNRAATRPIAAAADNQRRRGFQRSHRCAVWKRQRRAAAAACATGGSGEQTSEIQSLLRSSYDVFSLTKKITNTLYT